MTPKQAQILSVLRELGDKHPTVRSLSDHMETRYHRSERWSDNEVRGLAERLIDEGLVAKYRGDKNEVRYKATSEEPNA